MVRDYLLSVAVMAAVSVIWFAVQRLRQVDAERDHHPTCSAAHNHCERACRGEKLPGGRN